MAYLTSDQYIARFGELEATRVTDETRSGQPDEAKIDEQIAYASDLANSYLAGRYTLPIDPAPALLEGVVADIARRQLHGSKPTQIVIDNADRAVSYLKDLAAGRATLPTVEGAAPPVENPTGDPVSSHDGRPRVFTADALAGFTGMGRNRFGTVFDGPANW
jgi:phage gp36-like protein